MAWLTKSRFMSGLQCPKRLWLEVHEPIGDGLPDSLALANGRAVDRLAQSLRPGVLISRDRGMPAAIAATARCIGARAAAGAKVSQRLYQPAFRAGEFAAIADVLETGECGTTLTEVKSSTSVKPEHTPDVAFQTLVLRRSGQPVDRALLAHVNRNFVLQRAGDYAGLLTEHDLSGDIEAALPQIGEDAVRLHDAMGAPRAPAIPMGAQCTTPYACPFIERCTAEAGPPPRYPVELLPNGGKTIAALRAEGYRDLREVPPERLHSAMHRRVHRATLSGQAFYDAAATERLRALQYPMSYLDFETIGLAVPEIIGAHPYEHAPFQWSLHVEASAESGRHAEYLAIDNFGNLAALAGALIGALPAAGPVFAYHAPFERGVLEHLATRLPVLAAPLRQICERLFDLLPVTKAAYYHPDMQGSWSIKAVLPTIAPELDYTQLAVVQEADGAQLAFLELRYGQPTPARREQLRSALLAYCERDTWGMVRLRRFLCTGSSMRGPRSASGY